MCATRFFRISAANIRPNRFHQNDGTIWYTGQMANLLGHIDPTTGRIDEYLLNTPMSGPHGLVADQMGDIWFTANFAGYRQARPRFREDRRIQTAGSGRARSAHAALRSKRRPLVHCAKRQHGWTSRSKDRTDQACYLAHPQIRSLRAGDRFKGRAVLLRIRREQAREPRPDNDGNPGILSAARR